MARRDVFLSDLLESEHGNSFNLVRLLAAAAVVVSHSFALMQGEITAEPLSGLTPWTLGQHAVNVFFVLSGMMLARSWALRPHLGRFVLARALRIFPGLLACGLVVALLIAAFGTTKGLVAYLTDKETLLYPLRVLFAFNKAPLDEVFLAGTTKPGAINGSLWTIKHELAAYALFTAAAVLGLVRRPAFAVAFLGGTTLAVIGIDLLAIERLAPALVPPGRFLMSFALGVAAYAFRSRIRIGLPVLLGLAAVALASHGSPLEKPAYVLLTGYGALCVGRLAVPGVSAWTAATDLSYGLYIYAWPIQQMLLFRQPEIPLAAHIVLSLAGGLVFAVLSWHLVEKPALSLKAWARAGSGLQGTAATLRLRRHP